MTSTATEQCSLPNDHTRRRRNEIKQNFHRISRSHYFTILALLTSSVSGGQFVFELLRGIIRPSRKGFRGEWSSRKAIYGSFASAFPLGPSAAHSSSSSSNDASMALSSEEMTPDSCNADKRHDRLFKVAHSDDPNLWLYHVEETTSAMDDAKSIVENFDAEGVPRPASFVVSAASQLNGRGTSQRNWDSSKRGNALFTVGIPQASWMKDLTSKNDGRRVPLTLLPLKVGSVVAFHIQRALEECVAKDGKTQLTPRVTVKWPNDVLIRRPQNNPASSSPAQESHEKIAGILIESSRDWFLIGIGVNVGYAPSIPREGANYGRRATCLSQYCAAADGGGDGAEDGAREAEKHWIAVSRTLARDVAHDLHSWLFPPPSSPPSRAHAGEAILDQWKSYLDWDMELVLRDTPRRERVTLTEILEDGRAVVREAETGRTRTLVSDYFL